MARKPRRAIERSPAPRRRTIGLGIGIVHEDADVLVLDKPAGLPSVPPPGQDVESVFGAVKEYVRKAGGRLNVRGRRLAWIIHRLDREVSGLMVFAKSERAYERLKADLAEKRVERRYQLIVPGSLRMGQTHTVRGLIVEDERGLMRHIPLDRAHEQHGNEQAQHAVTHLRVMRTGRTRSLLEARLETGRKNQIRVHLAAIGRPIIGDRRFGSLDDPLGRVCLHATELRFCHPGTGEQLEFALPLPPVLVPLLGGLREDESLAGTDDLAPPEESPAQQAVRHSWDHVAAWYDDLIEHRRSDHHDEVILPGVLRLLDARKGARVLDVACGQGILCRALRERGVDAFGIDAAPALIERARTLDPQGKYSVADARGLLAMRPPGVEAGGFDAAACVMALMNIEPLAPVMQGLAHWVRPGGVVVGVILHPAFRSPGQTSWGWDRPARADAVPTRGRERPSRREATPRQYRRVDAYLSPTMRTIVMNPGAVARGASSIETVTHHRSIGSYVEAFARAGLLVNAIEEWASKRVSEPGPRASEENRARAEIPLFAAIRSVRVSPVH